MNLGFWTLFFLFGATFKINFFILETWVRDLRLNLRCHLWVFICSGPHAAELRRSLWKNLNLIHARSLYTTTNINLVGLYLFSYHFCYIYVAECLLLVKEYVGNNSWYRQVLSRSLAILGLKKLGTTYYFSYKNELKMKNCSSQIL